MKTLNLLFLIVFFCPNLSFGQGKWTNYSTDNGLASTWVRDCIEDGQGNLWFATDKGLSKFDGSTMVSFTKNEGLPLETLKELFLDKNGTVWFTIEPGNNFAKAMTGSAGAAGSLLGALTKRGNGWGRYDGNKIVGFMNKVSSDYLWSHLENVNGEIWIGGMNRKDKNGCFLINYDGKTLNPITKLGGADFPPVSYFYSKGKDNIWFSSLAEKGDFIYHFDGNKLTAYGEKDGLPSKAIYRIVNKIFEDRKGDLWFGAIGGLMKFDGTHWTIYNKDNGLIGDDINQIVEDKDGNIWVATDKAVNAFDGSSWENYTDKNKLPSKYITDLKVDSKGRVWIGTLGGLVLFDHGKWSTFNKKNGLTHNAVQKIFEDSRGNIWVGTGMSWKWGGISVFDGNNWKPFDFRHVLATNFFEDSKGNVWVLSLGKGVYKYEF
jgi:ligand-binding sensor domain-containing protein